jgi:TolA-binding protein
MAQNNPPLPNYDKISSALVELSTELPRIANITPQIQEQQILQILQQQQQFLQQLQQIQVQLQHIQEQQQHIQEQQQQVLGRLTAIENRTYNSRVKTINAHREAGHPGSHLLPLRDIQTGVDIPVCPTTAPQISVLTASAANQILAALQVPAPATLAAKRETVRYELL